MAGTGGTHVLVLAVVVLLAAAAKAERTPRVKRTPQGLSQSYSFAPTNFNLGSGPNIGPALSDYGGLGGLTGLSGLNSGLNFGGSDGLGSFGARGGGLDLNFDLGGSSNSYGSDFNFPNFGNFPKLGQNKAAPYIPPVSRVLKEGINAFLPAGAKKIVPGDKAYVEFESALSDKLPKLEPIIKNLGGKNPFDVIRQTATNPLQTAFTRVIDDPTYSPLPFPKSEKEQTEELVRHVEHKLHKVDKQLTAEEKNTQKIYQSIDGVSLVTSSSKPVGNAVVRPDADGHEYSSADTNHEQIVAPENYVSHDGFPITDDSKLSPFQSQSKVTSAISMKENTFKIPGRVEPKTVSISPPKHFDHVTVEDEHISIRQVQDKQPFEIKDIIESSDVAPKPEMVKHYFAKPGVHPQKLQPIGRPENSNGNYKSLEQENESINYGHSSVSNIIKPTPKPEVTEDFLFGLFQTRRPTAVTEPSVSTNKDLHSTNIADKINAENDQHSNILQEFGLKPLPKPPKVEESKLLSGAEILLLVKKSNAPPPFPPQGDFSVGPSSTVETVVKPEVTAEQTSESKVQVSLESPPEKGDETSLPVLALDQSNSLSATVTVDSSHQSGLEEADDGSASSQDTSSLEVRDVLDSADIRVNTSTIVHSQLFDRFSNDVIANETIDHTTDFKFPNRANNHSFNMSTDINDKIKRHSNERLETSTEAPNDEFITASVLERPILDSVAKRTHGPRDYALTALETPTTPGIQGFVAPKKGDVTIQTKKYPEETTKTASTSIKYSEEFDENYFFMLDEPPNNVTDENKAISFDNSSIVSSISSDFSNESAFDYSNHYLKSIYEEGDSQLEQPSFRISKRVTRPPKFSTSTEQPYPPPTIFPPSKFVSRPTSKPWSIELRDVTTPNLDEQSHPNSEDGSLNLSYFSGKSLVSIPIYNLGNRSTDQITKKNSPRTNSSLLNTLKSVPLITLQHFEVPVTYNNSSGNQSLEPIINVGLEFRGGSATYPRNSPHIKRKASTSNTRSKEASRGTMSLSSLIISNARKSAPLREETVPHESIKDERDEIVHSSINRSTPSASLERFNQNITEKYREHQTRNPFSSIPVSIHRKGDKLSSSHIVLSFVDPIEEVEVSTQKHRTSALLDRPDKLLPDSTNLRRSAWSSSSKFNDMSLIQNTASSRHTTLQKPFQNRSDTSTALPPPDAQIRSSVKQVKHSPATFVLKQLNRSEKSSLWPITSFVRYSSSFYGSNNEVMDNVSTNTSSKRSQILPLPSLTSEGIGYRKAAHFPSGNNERSEELSKFLTMELLKINSDSPSSQITNNSYLSQTGVPLHYSEYSSKELPNTKETSSVKLFPSIEASLKTRQRKDVLSKSGEGMSNRRTERSTIASVNNVPSSTHVTEGGASQTYSTLTGSNVTPLLLSKAKNIMAHTTTPATKSQKDATTAGSKTISLKLTGFRTEKLLKIV